MALPDITRSGDYVFRTSLPKLLLVDELSFGIDAENGYQALGKLKDSGITIVLVEQSTTRALDIADHVCVLESGRTVWQGSAEIARTDPAMFDAYLGLEPGGAQENC
ncbi:MAG: hypothetical protein OEU36_08500 [Gammaproteobacteria bacterium]|nr:hypothetical protein [Gammaproteobacteria bacterium]